jgi:hypothetical protein
MGQGVWEGAHQPVAASRSFVFQLTVLCRLHTARFCPQCMCTLRLRPFVEGAAVPTHSRSSVHLLCCGFCHQHGGLHCSATAHRLTVRPYQPSFQDGGLARRSSQCTEQLLLLLLLQNACNAPDIPPQADREALPAQLSKMEDWLNESIGPLLQCIDCFHCCRCRQQF